MLNKKDFLETIYSNDAVKAALQQIRSKSEKDTTKAVVDEVLGNFYDQISNVFQYMQNNSESLKKIVTEKESDLITDRDKPTNGEQKD